MDELSLKSELRELHDSLGFKLGWDFAVTPMANLKKAETILVALNPGGDCYAESWESTDGNAYFTGKWGKGGSSKPTSVQTQVRALHKLLDINQDDIFAAQFFPFRSKSWKEIKGEKYNRGMNFSRRLWTWVLEESKAKRFICMGADATDQIAKLLNISLENPEEYLTGWARDTSVPEQKIARYVSNDGKYVLVKWPHPSRFLIFSQNNIEYCELSKNSMRKAAQIC